MTCFVQNQPRQNESVVSVAKINPHENVSQTTRNTPSKTDEMASSGPPAGGRSQDTVTGEE
ncbi:hypothetical protein JOB18_031779 [Solea senegalensis]|uniref:Uncharacterized protein n=1 Tax=Solea senegalensis TaxID=28829 RepID=A0AAV6PJD6_SOLSE|nr:hypothetical protein JOB18_031779 [Solea senegalensis]